MRPDTPQKYEYVLVEDIEGHDIGNFIFVRPWTQFFDLKGEQVSGTSTASNITMRNIKLDCDNFFNVGIPGKSAPSKGFSYKLSDFRFENIEVTAKNYLDIDTSMIENCKLKKVIVNKKKVF